MNVVTRGSEYHLNFLQISRNSVRFSVTQFRDKVIGGRLRKTDFHVPQTESELELKMLVSRPRNRSDFYIYLIICFPCLSSLVRQLPSHTLHTYQKLNFSTTTTMNDNNTNLETMVEWDSLTAFCLFKWAHEFGRTSFS